MPHGINLAYKQILNLQQYYKYKYNDGFALKPHNCFFSGSHFIAEINLDKAMLQFDIKHIRMRTYLDQCFVSPEHLRNLKLHGFDAEPSIYRTS